MSEAVIVIESDHAGEHDHRRFAGEQGRQVLAVGGLIRRAVRAATN